MPEDIDKIRIIVEPDTTGFQQELDADLSKVKGEVRIDADTTEFKSEVSKAKKEAEATEVDIDIDADTTAASVKVKTFVKNAEREEIDIPVDVDTNRATARLKTFLSRAEKQVQGSSRRMGGSLNASANEIQNLGQLTIPPVLISGLFALGAAASASAAGIVAAVAPVVELSAGLASLPAIIGSAVVATKTLEFAFMGVGDALGGLNEGIDEDKFAALTPEAQGLVRTLDALKAPIIEVQQVVQRNLFPAIEGAIEQFEMFGPAARDAASEVSAALANVIDRATSMATSAEGAGLIQTQLRLLAPMIESMGNSLANLTLAMLKLADAARPFTSFIVRGFERWTASLAAGVNEGGELTEFFMDLRLTAGVVFRLFRNLGALMQNIFAGATPTGRELLLMLNLITARTNAFFNTAEGENALHQYFQDAKPAIIEIARIIRDISLAFIELARDPSIPEILRQVREELLPAVGELLLEFNDNLPSIIDLLQSLVELFTELAPAVQTMANAIESVLTPLGDFLDENPRIAEVVTTMLGLATATALLLAPLKILNGLFKPFFSILSKLKGPIKFLITALTRGLLGVIVRILPFLGFIVGAFASVIAAIGAVPLIIAAVVVAFGILIAKSENVRLFIISMGLVLLNFFTSIPGWVKSAVSAVGGFLSGLPDLFARAFNAAVNFVKAAITTYIQIVTFIPRRTMAAIASLARLLWNFYRNVWTTAFNIIKGIVTSIISFAMGIPQRIINAMISLGQLLWSFATNAWNRFREAVVTVSQNIMGFVRGIPGRIVAALGNLARLLYGKGKDVMQGLFDGLKAVWENIKDWLSGIGDKIKSLKGPIEVDRTLLVDEGRAIMEGFHNGLKDRWDGVENFLGSRGGFIKGLLNPSGVSEALKAVAGLFTGELSLGEVTGKLDELSFGGLHPTSGLADTTAMANMIARRFALTISSIFRSYDTVAGPRVSQHTLGEAADFVGAAAALDRAAQTLSHLVGRVFTQIIWRNQLWSGGRMGFGYVGNHLDHMHAGWIRRETGGRVRGGQNYLVGERGPEPFIPDSSGYVLSNNKFARLLALGDRVRTLEMTHDRQRDAVESGTAGVTQDIDFNVTMQHMNPDASSILAILSSRLDAFAQASLPALAGGIQ